MKPRWNLGLTLVLALTSRSISLDIPLEVEQLPTITAHTSSPIVALPFDDSFTMSCEAKGNPMPEYRWTKDGQDFLPPHDTMIKTEKTNGSFVLHNRQLSKFQGKYRCFASNKLGTAMTEEIELFVPSIPKFPKEKMEPIVVNVGEPFVLSCNPPDGMPPRKIYWMTIGLQHIEQDSRVSMGENGNLYFSNALETDSRQDYCCFAAFSKIRTIVQKTAMSVVVQNSSQVPMRSPSLLLPSGVQTEVVLVKGQELKLECIAGGLPTPMVKWIKMGEDLPQQMEIKNHGKLLTIPDVDERVDGKYMCKANNSLGEAVHYFDVIVEEPPKWLTGPPQSKLAVSGSDVHIKCSATGKPRPAITWRRNGQILDDKLSILLRVSDDTIVLHNARPKDSAVYQCEVSNRHGSLLANANILVLNMAPLMLTGDSQEYAVVKGGDTIMNCSVFGSPPPDISWVKVETPETREGERFSKLQNGSFHIIKAQKEDSGEYVCFTNNTEGQSAITAMLDVKDNTRIVGPPQDLQAVTGSMAQLLCQAEYDKTLRKQFHVVWMKDGEEIPLNFTGNSKYFAAEGLLQIMNVNQTDQGKYTCVAKTHLDQDNATAELTVLDVPDAPVNLKITEVTSRRVLLSWVPGPDHNSSVTEFVVEYEESRWEPGRWRELLKVPGNQATAQPELHGYLTYQFRVYAINAIGPGPPSEPTETYRTLPAAPDKNPENIKIQGHLPHQMDISWEPLLPLEHNGPGLEYKVSYRRLGVEDIWKEHLVKRHSFVVKNTPTFVPYEIKIQSRNSHGWGPEPKVVTGYSGEDVPTASPRDVAVEVINTTVLRVSWTRVPLVTLRGHLGGYSVHWLRKRSLLTPEKVPDERQSLSFPGNRSFGMVPGLRPFSEYMLTVNVFNKKGNGPKSDPVTFQTPEGVPEQVPILTASNAQKDSISLVWGPPLQANGVLTGYLLKYQLINETTAEVGDSLEETISGPDTTHWLLQGLEEGSLYHFHLSACTVVGCGPPVTQEARTLAPPRRNCSSSFPSCIQDNATLPSLVPVLLNISSYVSDTYAKISWTARDEQQDSQLYVAYMNNRVAPLQSSVSTQGWFIGTMCAVALLTLTVLIACFVRRNKGGKYAGTLPPPQRPDISTDQVKEKEDLNADVESQEVNDDTFCEYSDSDEKPLKADSLCSLSAGDGMSRDSLVDYADGGPEFNEDGSFIGEYSGRKHRGSTDEPNVSRPVEA